MEIKAKHFKLIYFLLFLCFSSFSSYSQNVGISPQGSGNPNSNAGLDINYTNKGLLIPRIALASTSSASPLSAHVAGMIVYNTVSAAGLTPGLYYNNGAKWNLVFQKTVAAGGMQYWDGSSWKTIPSAQPGFKLKIDQSGVPTWAP